MKVNKTDYRAVRGYSILAKGDTPKLIDKETFLVPSQSSDKKYKVSHEVSWVCECPDFQNRKQKCKHIYSVEFLLKMRNKLDNDSNLDFVEEMTNVKSCQYCNSGNIVKNGSIRNKNDSKQRFLCRDCKKTFYSEPHLNYLKNPKIISLAFDLYFKGLSLRKITDTLNQFFGIKIHHETVRRWLNKFSQSMEEYIKQFEPKVSEAWHLDEQAIKSKGEKKWVWNIIDENTRFLIANNVTDSRYIEDAREILQKAKQVTKAKPEFIITDGLWSYEKSIAREFPSNNPKSKNSTKHVRLETLKKKPNNNLIERYHNSFREFDKVRRGFKTEHTAQGISDGFRVYYNYVRKHNGILNQTPAEKANIDLQLDRNRWLSLLKQSLTNK